jgi:hypothetical protein
LQKETQTIPIVFTYVIDPIGAGFINSLAHPGGNLTGIMAYEPAMIGKWLSMLKEIAPQNCPCKRSNRIAVNVRSWHLTDMTSLFIDVRFRG